MAGGDIKCGSHGGKSAVSSICSLHTHMYNVTQQCHLRGHTQEKRKHTSTQRDTHKCSRQPCPLEPKKRGNNPSVCQLNWYRTREGAWGEAAERMQGLLWGNENVPELDSEEECAALRRLSVNNYLSYAMCHSPRFRKLTSDKSVCY